MFEIRISEDAERHLQGLSTRDRRIVVVAVAVKDGNRFMIEGEEYPL
jgi:hypothetical protein